MTEKSMIKTGDIPEEIHNNLQQVGLSGLPAFHEI
jgi:hypothetical protein